MDVRLTDSDQARLAELAKAAGFADVEIFVRTHLQALASTPTAAELPPLNEAELQASLAMCDRGMQQIAQGGGRDAREALREIGRKRGYRIGE